VRLEAFEVQTVRGQTGSISAVVNALARAGIELGPNKDNLAGWADYAKRNSYHPDKTELKHNLGGEGAKADFAAHDVERLEATAAQRGR
jgi:hypothetical protein